MIALAVALALSACSGPRTATTPPGPASPASSASPGSPAAWAGFRHVTGVIDLAGPRSDGSFLVAAGRRLVILGRDGTLSPFARGAGGYTAAAGDEPYLVIADGVVARGGPCAFPLDAAFAIAPGRHPGIIMISPG